MTFALLSCELKCSQQHSWFDCGVVAGAVLSLGTVTFLIFNLAKSVVVLTTFFSPVVYLLAIEFICVPLLVNIFSNFEKKYRTTRRNPVDPTIMAAFDAAANANAMTIVVPGVSFPLSQVHPNTLGHKYPSSLLAFDCAASAFRLCDVYSTGCARGWPRHRVLRPQRDATHRRVL